MPAASYDLMIEQGATFSQTVTWKDSNNVPVDLTGYTARMQFRPSVNAPTVYFSATSTDGRIVLGGATGAITINISAVETTAFTFVSAVYDLELQSASGVVTRLLEGGVSVSREVTR